MAEIELTLNSPITEEQWDAITDVDFDNTNRIWFHTKHGKQVEFVKVKSPPTNADRIRSMSDEELAVFMSDRSDELYFPMWTGEPTSLPNTEQAWLDWLRSPVGGDGDG